MAVSIKLQVFDSMAGSYVIDQDVSVTNWGEVKDIVNPQPGQRFTWTGDRSLEDPFSNPAKLVSGDIKMHRSAAASKAGAQ